MPTGCASSRPTIAPGFTAIIWPSTIATPFGIAASPGLFLAAVAQRTNRRRFGPMVYLLPSAVASQLPLAVPTPRCRAAHHRQLSAHLRRARGTRQWGSPARRGRCATFSSRRLRRPAPNDILSWFAFGDMTLDESLRSLALFASDVMPAFAPAAAAE
jgi:hypothetical protein